MLVERVGVWKGLVARDALVDKAVELVEMLEHYVRHRFPASFEGLRTQSATVEFLWDRFLVEREFDAIVRRTLFVLVLALRVTQQHFVTVTRENLIELVAVVFVHLVAQVPVQLLIARLLQVDVQWIEKENFVLDLDIVKRRRHEMLIQVGSQRRYSLEFLVANLATRCQMCCSGLLQLLRLLILFILFAVMLVSQMRFIVGTRHEGFITIFTVD